MDLGIIGGAYESPVKPLAAQRCANLFPEVAEAQARAKIYLRRTPGLKTWCTGLDGAFRGGIEVRGVAYAVAGNKFYSINEAGTETDLGDVLRTGPVSMASNGIYTVIVNGFEGYTYNISTGTFAQITDADFLPADIVFFLDGYFVFHQVDSGNVFISALNDPTSYDATEIQSYSRPEYMRSMVIAQDDIFILGRKKSNVWRNTGNVDFPFQNQAGAEMERGCIARHSPAQLDNTVYFLGDDRVVYRIDGYTPVRISHHAIEAYLGDLAPGIIETATGFTYTQEGHYFYVLRAGNRTWVYDATVSGQIGQSVWHERSSELDTAPWKALGYIGAYGKHLVGDSEGNIWELSKTTYTEGGDLIKWVRTTAPYFDEVEDVSYSKIELVMKVGVGGETTAPSVEMRRSDDGGYTWSDPRSRSMGKSGEYGTRVIWRRGGQFAPHRIYEFSGSDDSDVAIIAGYMDG